MKKKNGRQSTIRFSPDALEMVGALATQTGWSKNVSANRLIELGMYHFSRLDTKADAAVDSMEVALQKHLIELDAARRIAALRNQLPAKRHHRPMKGTI